MDRYADPLGSAVYEHALRRLKAKAKARIHAPSDQRDQDPGARGVVGLAGGQVKPGHRLPP